MNPFVSVLLCMVALGTAVTDAFPQTAPGPAQVTRETSSVEVTPFFALGSDFTSRVGGAVAFAVSAKVSLEAEVGYARTAIDTVNASANLSTVFPAPDASIRIWRQVPDWSSTVSACRCRPLV